MDREPWPKPLPPLTAGNDPVAHLARRAPSDPGVTQLVTVRVHGGDQDGAEIWLPLADVRAVLRRAQHFRASHWLELDNRFVIEAGILVAVGDSPLPMRMPSGWIEVGRVADSWAGPDWLAVHWHEASDRLRVQTPRPWCSKPEVDPPPPLFLTNAGGVSSEPLIARAHQGYRYWYEGQEYSPAEAERLVLQLGSVEGWTWEGQ